MTDLFICDCYNIFHQLVLESDEENDETVIYASFHLMKLPLADRLKTFLNLLLRPSRPAECFDSFLFKASDLERFGNHLRYLTKNDGFIGKSSPSNSAGSYTSGKEKLLFETQLESREYRYRFTVSEWCDTLSPDQKPFAWAAISVDLKPYPYWKRAWKALRILTGYQSCYGPFDAFEIYPADAPQLLDFVATAHKHMVGK